MLSGISTIYFNTELSFPEIPAWAIKKDQIRELYNKLQAPGGYPYENLDLQAAMPTLSTRHERGMSRCQVGTGKIRIEEDDTPGTLDDFILAVRSIVGCLSPRIGLFFPHRCMIRCTAQPTVSEDSLLLLAGSVANVLDPIEPFGRPPSNFGVRFRFPPVMKPRADSTEEDKKQEGEDSIVQAETADKKEPAIAGDKRKRRQKKSGRNAESQPEFTHRGHYTLRFETYSRDIKKVWMELAAEYFEPIEASNIAEIEQNIRDTHSFLVDNGKRFLEQFDKPKDAGEAGKEKQK